MRVKEKVKEKIGNVKPNEKIPPVQRQTNQNNRTNLNYQNQSLIEKMRIAFNK